MIVRCGGAPKYGEASEDTSAGGNTARSRSGGFSFDGVTTSSNTKSQA